MSGERLQKLAEVMAGELKPELRLLLEGAEARILEKLDSVKVNDIVNISLHIFLKDITDYAASSKAP